MVKSGVGRDKISDFTTNMIKEFLLLYSQEFAKKYIDPKYRKVFPINRVRFNYEICVWERGSFELPFYNDDYVILTPKDMLTKDETWINKSDLIKDFDDVAESIPNDQLRAQINIYFRNILPKKPKPKDISEAKSIVIGKFPEFIDHYIRNKENNGDKAISLSKLKVREVQRFYIDQLRLFVQILSSESDFYNVGSDTFAETQARVMFLKDVIENKGGHKLFFANGIPIRRESDVHILFRLTCFGTPSDVSREVNDGRGPADFKLSRGSFDKSLVEFKLAKNTHLKQNLQNQIAIYEKASDARRSLRVILYFTDDELSRVQRILKELSLQDNEDIILIDARDTNKPSGSKA